MNEMINPCPFCDHDQPEVFSKFQENVCRYLWIIECPKCRFCCICESEAFDDSQEALKATIDVWNRKTFLEIFDEAVAKYHASERS